MVKQLSAKHYYNLKTKIDKVPTRHFNMSTLTLG